MTIAVWGPDIAFEELSSGIKNIEWQRPSVFASFLHADASMLINLSEDAACQDYSPTLLPVIIHSVVHGLTEQSLPPNVIRINGWPGFIKRPLWEYAGTLSESHARALSLMGKEAVSVPDEPGLVAARIISMIVNEAYFAKDEQVSTEPDIDIAMKLGTNYPYGPFEWAKLIGPEKIVSLLQRLAQTDARYTPSPLLIKEAVPA